MRKCCAFLVRCVQHGREARNLNLSASYSCQLFRTPSIAATILAAAASKGLTAKIQPFWQLLPAVQDSQYSCSNSHSCCQLCRVPNTAAALLVAAAKSLGLAVKIQLFSQLLPAV
jgi:hypothetical protein